MGNMLKQRSAVIRFRYRRIPDNDPIVLKAMETIRDINMTLGIDIEIEVILPGYVRNMHSKINEENVEIFVSQLAHGLTSC